MPSRFARNSAFGVLAGLSGALGGFLSSVIVARLLGLDGVGVVAYAMWIAASAVTIADLGLSITLARFLPELSAREESDQSIRLPRFLFRIIAAAVVVLFTGFAAYAAYLRMDSAPTAAAGSVWSSLAEPMIWLLIGILCGTQTLAGYMFGYLQGLQRFDRLAFLTSTSVLIQIVALVVGSAEFGVAGALVGYASGSILPAIMCWRFVRGEASLSRETRKRVMRCAAYFWAATIMSTFVWSRIEVFFLERAWGSNAVGLFIIGLTLSSLATQGPMLLTKGLLPYFSERFGANEIGTMHGAYATSTRIMAFLTFPACFGMAAIIPVLLPLLYGHEFIEAVPVATILVSAAAFPTASSVGYSLVCAVERPGFVCLCGIVGSVLSVLAGLTVIRDFGAEGAALARAGIQLTIVVIGSVFISKQLHCRLPLASLGRLLLAAIMCALAARLSLGVIQGPTSLPFAILIGAVVYLVSVRALGALPRADVDRLRSVALNLPGRLNWFATPVLWLIAR